MINNVIRPSYENIVKKYAEYASVFSKIDELISSNTNAIIAIEGGSASGKTTLASILHEAYDCNVFHADDFFLRPEQRTRERLEEIGGNLDRERFFEEIITPIKEQKEVCYRRFDCSRQTLCEPITVSPKRLTIVEGAYSMHPFFGKYYDYSIFLDIDSEQQKKRILKRNSLPLAARFFDEWIPLENAYFEATEIKNRADMIVSITSKKR